jgi:hypothetical protein
MADLVGEPLVTVPFSSNPPATDLYYYGALPPSGEALPEPSTLSICTPGDCSPAALALSPDGTRIGMLTQVDGLAVAEIVNVDGTGRHVVWQEEPGGSYGPSYELAFTPDGQSLAIPFYTSDGSGKVMLVDVDTGDTSTFLDGLQGASYLVNPSWSADGTVFAYLDWREVGPGSPPNRVVLMSPEGQRLGEVSAGDIQVMQSAQLSPDGSEVAFVGIDPTVSDTYTELYVVDVTSQVVTELTDSPANEELMPRWSADGNTIAFLQSKGDGTYTLKSVFHEGGTIDTIAPDLDWGFAIPTPSDLPDPDPGDASVEQMAAEYYVDEYGGTPSEALTWLDTQNRADTLGDALGDALPEGFGGLWFDNPTRRIKIALTADTPTGPVETELSRRGLTNDVDLVTVDYTENELRQAQPDIEDSLADLTDDGLVSIGRGVSSNSIEVTVASSATDQQRSRIDEVADSAPVRVTVLRSSEADLTVTPAACTFPHCDPPLRGGVEIASSDDKDDDAHLCTAGFLARGRTDQKPYLLTSGHCMNNFDDDDSRWFAKVPGDDWENIGPNHNPYLWGDDGDVGLISIEADSIWRISALGGRIRPLVYVQHSGTGSTPADASYYIRRVGTNQKGRIICMTGAVGGSSCGTTTNPDVEKKFNAGLFGIGGTKVRHLVEMKDCDPQEGDSGAPLFRKHVAYGSFSGGKDCLQYFEGARRTEDLLNVNVVTRR